MPDKFFPRIHINQIFLDVKKMRLYLEYSILSGISIFHEFCHLRFTTSFQHFLYTFTSLLKCPRFGKRFSINFNSPSFFVL